MAADRAYCGARCYTVGEEVREAMSILLDPQVIEMLQRRVADKLVKSIEAVTQLVRVACDGKKNIHGHDANAV